MAPFRIVICPDSFKGSISSADAARSIANGIRQGLLLSGVGEDEYELLCFPIGDGGEGTLEALVPNDKRRSIRVCGPLFDEVKAEYGIFSTGTDQDPAPCAVIEMAKAAGLTLIGEQERDVRITTTYGVGQMILDAIRNGAKRIILTAGGSATNDGGCGMAAALGARFLNARGEQFIPTGATLSEIASIDMSGLSATLDGISVTVATDVTNPLVGKTGASEVYAPQKGADKHTVEALEAGMLHYARLIESICKYNITSLPSLGAAGGLAVPLKVFCHAKIAPGIETVISSCGIADSLDGASLCITGEGRLDEQSLYGKVIDGISRLARSHSVPVWIICGCVEGDSDELAEKASLLGITALSTKQNGISAHYSMTHAAELLFEAGARLADKLHTIIDAK